MKKLYQGGCHCGAVRFECRLDPEEGTSRCNCSVCAKGRFWKAIARKEDFRILQGESDLSDYQFGSRNIHHLFCRQCGIKPFGRGHMDALGGTFYAVNVACLDGAAPEEAAAGSIQYQDGRNNAWDTAPVETRHL
ncbi:GFA family protein [Reyranella soli]|jgi:hypothetical protein|uniref:Aldehyde-activating protein n=1 Tax=Reyranella soli TaxID=1230389 RepID=A0A512NEX1_9HYPH|nr:GFA family protein [Reyranella soli]GEP57500.1 aldehyde-activating protein [Reyranella soli]